jgi:hypothetical protein
MIVQKKERLASTLSTDRSKNEDWNRNCRFVESFFYGQCPTLPANSVYRFLATGQILEEPVSKTTFCRSLFYFLELMLNTSYNMYSVTCYNFLEGERKQRKKLHCTRNVFTLRFSCIVYVPLAYILHLLESCRFSKRICFPGQFRIQRDSM